MPVAFDRDPVPESDDLEVDRQVMAVCLTTHIGPGLAALYRRFNDPDNIWRSLNAKFALSMAAEKAKIKREWESLRVEECGSLDDFETKLHVLADRMTQVGYENNVTEADKMHKTIETLGSENTGLAMALRAGSYQTLDTLLYALREHNTNNQIMLLSGKESHKREVCETHFTQTKGKVGRNRPPGHKVRAKSAHKGKPKGWVKNGKPLPCFACGKPGHVAKDCRAPPEVVKSYLYNYHLKRQGIETHSTQVQDLSAKPVGTGQTPNAPNPGTSNLGEMDIDEREIIDTLGLEDRLHF
jgi:hypothetical protein